MKNFDEFFEFLRFPSIATDPSYHEQVRACAEWLQNAAKRRGLHTELWETSGAPTLFISDLNAGSDKPIVLFYGHYDVQPVDPLDEWTTPPFEPSIRQGKIYARGASDDKGQMFYTLCAIGDYLAKHGLLPFNLKMIIEGEEESASSGLKQLLQSHKERLKADHLIVVDVGLKSLEEPSITLGARGIVGFTVTCREGSTDLHSGQCGGLAYNPNRALVQLLSKLHDSTGSVNIPGFYDDVIAPTDHELQELYRDFSEPAFEACYGFKPHGMERDVDPTTSNWLRPTLEINGIQGGYSGPGLKTVIPCTAIAKLSCRLVPRQNPEQIATLVTDFLHRHASPALPLSVEVLPGSGPGFRCSPHSTIAKLTAQSYSEVFKKPCRKLLTGGSIPITPNLMEASGAEVVLIGTALPTDRIHAPDESFSIESFEKGYQVIYRLIELFN